MKIFEQALYSLFTFIYLCLGSADARAYKVEIHSELTEQAAKQSVLARDGLWLDWGYSGSTEELPVEQLSPESEITWDGLLVNGAMKPNASMDYARLMSFGADVEDSDLDVSDNILPASRAFNHFFNPQANKKLSVPTDQENHTSPAWALEDEGVWLDQARSYRDAISYFYDSFSRRAKADRLSSLGKTVHTLGHVVHHIQDMAQPQHTRLDSHCDADECEWVYKHITGDDDASVYEVFTKNLIGCGVFSSPNSSPTEKTCPKFLDSNVHNIWFNTWSTMSIPLNSYGVVEPSDIVGDLSQFRPRMFWTNSSKSGLADFSSRNFISTDTAYQIDVSDCGSSGCNDGLVGYLAPHSDDLPFPDGAPETPFSDGTYTLTYDGGQPLLKDLLSDAAETEFNSGFLNTRIRFVGTTFFDNYKNVSISNDRAATYSIFHERLKRFNWIYNDIGYGYTSIKVPVFTTNYFNLEKQAQILMPMAVGYSAGLINYFFRYRFDASFDEQNSRIAVTNLSEYEFGGELQFYFDDSVGNRTRVESNFVITPTFSVIIPPGQTAYYTVDLDNYPENADGEFVVVGIGRSSGNQGGYTGIFGKTFVVPRPAEPQICKGPVYSVDSGYSTHTFNLGGSAGTVQAWLKTASPCYINPFMDDANEAPCPDYSFEVDPSNSSQSLVYVEPSHALTGTTSTLQSFYFDPQVLGTTSVTVRVHASTNNYVSALYLGCPGDSVSESEHDVAFTFKETSAWYSCDASLEISGVGTVAIKDGVRVEVPLKPGMSTFNLTPKCLCNDICPINSTVQTSFFISGSGGGSAWKTNFEGRGAILVGFDGNIRFVE